MLIYAKTRNTDSYIQQGNQLIQAEMLWLEEQSKILRKICIIEWRCHIAPRIDTRAQRYIFRRRWNSEMIDDCMRITHINIQMILPGQEDEVEWDKVKWYVLCGETIFHQNLKWVRNDILAGFEMDNRYHSPPNSLVGNNIHRYDIHPQGVGHNLERGTARSTASSGACMSPVLHNTYAYIYIFDLVHLQLMNRDAWQLCWCVRHL